MGRFRHHKCFPNPRLRDAYLLPHVCLHCRKSFKKPRNNEPRKCPQCSGELIPLSRKFSAPAASNSRGWELVEFLIAHGARFYGAREFRPPNRLLYIPYPRTMAQAEQLVARASRGEVELR